MMERARSLLALVGLEGFETGIRRALRRHAAKGFNSPRARARSQAPPHGRTVRGLDAITRERLNIELLRIWQETGKTILFVTHGINEAVFLSDRVIVLSARPSKMIESLDIKLPRPRLQEVRVQPQFGVYALEIYKSLEIG